LKDWWGGMTARKIILDAMHEARAVLLHHVQTKHGGEPEKTSENLRAILESVGY
jgi:hypothetical protein